MDCRSEETRSNMLSLHKLLPQQSPLTKWRRIFFHKLKSIPKVKKNMTPSASSFASMDITKQLEQVFDLIDIDGDGRISSLELGNLLSNLSRNEPNIIRESEEILRAADLNGDGFVDFDEFLMLFGTNDDDEDLVGAFRVFDVDRDGFISASDIRRVLAGLGHKECSLQQCRRMIRGVDKNGDGLIDFQEFRSMMTCSRSTRI